LPGVKRALVFVGLALVLAAARPVRAQEVVFVVRHAERADNSADSPLSAAGEQRAAHLAAMLKDAGITGVITTDLLRTIQTAAPTAREARVQALALPAKATNQAVVKIRAAGPHARLLVVGHSNTVPDILHDLGVTTKVEIGENEYDNLFIVIPQAGGAPHLLRLRY
jgi:broad specificity phosphatase PhoE